MRIIENKQVVEVIKRTRTYQCDSCDFTSNSKWEVENHEAATHLDIKIVKRGRLELYRVADEETLRKYSKYLGGVNVIIKWDGPGWYGVYAHNINDEVDDMFLKPAKTCLEKRAEEANEMLNEANEMLKNIEKLYDIMHISDSKVL
jgi:hypothetical protein